MKQKLTQQRKSVCFVGNKRYNIKRRMKNEMKRNSNRQAPCQLKYTDIFLNQFQIARKFCYLVIHDGTHAQYANVNVIFRFAHVETRHVPGSPFNAGAIFQLVQRRPQATVIQRRRVPGTDCKTIIVVHTRIRFSIVPEKDKLSRATTRPMAARGTLTGLQFLLGTRVGLHEALLVPHHEQPEAEVVYKGVQALVLLV